MVKTVHPGTDKQLIGMFMGMATMGILAGRQLSGKQANPTAVAQEALQMGIELERIYRENIGDAKYPTEPNT